jgi:hypothetical protein
MEILASLLCALKAVCAAFPDPRRGRSGNIAMADFGLSAFAMFFMQSASFLSFQRTLERGHGRSNCQTLFGIEKIPSDNYIRDMLDGADPALLAPCLAARPEGVLSNGSGPNALAASPYIAKGKSKAKEGDVSGPMPQAHGGIAPRAGDARGLQPARRQNARRSRRDRVFLQPEGPAARRCA